MGYFPHGIFSWWDFVLLDFFLMGFFPLGFFPHGIFSYMGFFPTWDFVLMGFYPGTNGKVFMSTTVQHGNPEIWIFFKKSLKFKFWPVLKSWNHLNFVNISPTLVTDSSMERSSRVLHHGKQKNSIYASIIGARMIPLAYDHICPLYP